jgi:T5SS/PEP-CTERM-associated repeat protein
MQSITSAASITLACLISPAAQAAVKSVGSINPVPPGGGGTFTTQLVVGDDQAVSPDNRAWLQIDNGTSLQYGNLIVGDEETFVGEVNVLGNFLGPQGSPYTEFKLTGTTQIGRQGFGRLNLSGGATMTSNSLVVGVDAMGVGSISVSDPFTILTFNNDLHVGQGGIGQLEIDGGAWVQAAGNNSTVHIGTNATGVGTVVVDGISSVLRSGRNLRVGELGEGKLTVGDGAIVVADNTATATTITVGHLGRIEMGGGTLSGNTPTSATEFGTLVDGYLGGAGLVRSSVKLSDAARLEVGAGDVLRFDGKVNNQGAITVAGGELRLLAGFTNNSQGAMDDAPGRITLEDATIRFAQPLTNDGVITSALAAANNNQSQITTNTVHGQITNHGTILVASDTVAIFNDSVTNESGGTIRLLPRATALFLADL